MSKLKNIKVLTTAAMLSAVAVIFGFFKIPISNIIEIRLQTFPIAIAGALFGPYVGAIVGIIADVGGYIAKPTGAFFPGFTLSSALTGVIFGAFLNVKSSGFTLLWRTFLAVGVNTIVTGLLLNTLWLSILYGNPLSAVFIARLPKEVVMIPINIVILYLALVPIRKAAVRILGDII